MKGGVIAEEDLEDLSSDEEEGEEDQTDGGDEGETEFISCLSRLDFLSCLSRFPLRVSECQLTTSSGRERKRQI